MRSVDVLRWTYGSSNHTIGLRLGCVELASGHKALASTFTAACAPHARHRLQTTLRDTRIALFALKRAALLR